MVRPITDVLRHLRGGCLIDDASEDMAELVKAVDSTSKTGKLTIEITVRKATAGAMAITGKVVCKKPTEPVPEALMFSTPEGNLLTEDPRQNKLDLKPVSAAAPALKQASA